MISTSIAGAREVKTYLIPIEPKKTENWTKTDVKLAHKSGKTQDSGAIGRQGKLNHVRLAVAFFLDSPQYDRLF